MRSPRTFPDPCLQPTRIPPQYIASPAPPPDAPGAGDENHNCVRKTSDHRRDPEPAGSPVELVDPQPSESQAVGYPHPASESKPPLPVGDGTLLSATLPESAASFPSGSPLNHPRSSRRCQGSPCWPGPVSMPESDSPFLQPAPSDQSLWVRFSPMPGPLDAPFPLPSGFHPLGLKEGLLQSMEVAASPRPQIFEPHHRLHVRPFIPLWQD